MAPNHLLDEGLGDQLYAPHPPGDPASPPPEQGFEHEPEPEPEESVSDTESRSNDFLGDDDLEPDDLDPGEDDNCGAFDDDPPDFRNFFIQTYLQSAFRGATNELIADALANQYNFLLELQSRGELSQELADRLLFFPLTLRALQR